jgi:hypothetical protein
MTSTDHLDALLKQYHAADQRLAKLIVRRQNTLRTKPCSILPPVARKQCRTHGKPDFFLSVLNILLRVLFFLCVPLSYAR